MCCKAGPDVAEENAIEDSVGGGGVKRVRLPEVTVYLVGIQRGGNDGCHVAVVEPHGEEEAAPEVHARTA